MRFYQGKHAFYGGLDLHGKRLYCCIMNKEQEILVHHPIRNTDTDKLLEVLAPFRHDIVLAAESCYGWYWVADFCADQGIEFILGHALYMKAIHGAKTKNDRVDSKKIALLAQSGMFPLAYVYPRKKRALRDLLRRRLTFVWQRGKLAAHIQTLNTQCNNAPLKRVRQSKTDRPFIAAKFDDMQVRTSVEADIEAISFLDKIIAKLDWHVKARTREIHRKEVAVLKSIKGVGDTIALTIVLEIDTIDRFPSHREFASYARLVNCPRESGGKRYPAKGRKIGNPYLKRVLSEAAVLMVGYNPRIKQWYDKRVNKHGKGKAYAIVAHKLGRAIFHMLKNGTAFDEDVFLSN